MAVGTRDLVGKTHGHWSDCALHNEPAYAAGPCDCGGLDLAAYDRYLAITSRIPSPRSLADFVCDGVAPSLVEPEHSELRDEARLRTSDLPGAHDRIAVLGGAHGMDFDEPSISVVGDRKALARRQRLTGNVPPHQHPPESICATSDSTGTTNG